MAYTSADVHGWTPGGPAPARDGRLRETGSQPLETQRRAEFIKKPLVAALIQPVMLPGTARPAKAGDRAATVLTGVAVGIAAALILDAIVQRPVGAAPVVRRSAPVIVHTPPPLIGTPPPVQRRTVHRR